MPVVNVTEKNSNAPYVRPGSEVYFRFPNAKNTIRSWVHSVPVLTHDRYRGQWKPYSAEFLADNESKLLIINLVPGADPLQMDGLFLWIGENIVVVKPGARLEDRCGNLIRLRYKGRDEEDKEVTLPRLFAVARIRTDTKDTTDNEPAEIPPVTDKGSSTSNTKGPVKVKTTPTGNVIVSA